MKTLYLKITSGLMLYLPYVCIAAETEKSQPVDPLSVSSVISMVMGLGLVLVLIFMMAWLVRRMGGIQLAGAPQLKVLGGLNLGAREKVVLVQVENKRLVIGVAQGQVNTLHVMDGDYDTIETTSTVSGSFTEKLAEAINKGLKK